MESTDKGTGVLSIEGEVTVLAPRRWAVVLQPGRGYRRARPAPRRRRRRRGVRRGARMPLPAPRSERCRAGRRRELPGLRGRLLVALLASACRARVDARFGDGDVLAPLELQTLDWRFRLRGPMPPGGEVALVLADDATVAGARRMAAAARADRRGHRPACRRRCQRDRASTCCSPSRRPRSCRRRGSCSMDSARPCRPMRPRYAPASKPHSARRRAGRCAGRGDRPQPAG